MGEWGGGAVPSSWRNQDAFYIVKHPFPCPAVRKLPSSSLVSCPLGEKESGVFAQETRPQRRML